MLKKLGVIALVVGSCTSLLAVGCSSSSSDGSSEEDSGGGGGGGKSDGGGLGSDGGGGGFGGDGGLGGKDSGGGSKGDGGGTITDGGTTIPDAGDGGIVVHPVDGGSDSGTTTPGDAGPPACYMTSGADPDQTSGAPVAGQGHCTTADITAWDTACWASGSDDSTCDAWITATANNTCASCIYGTDTAGQASPVMIGITSQYVTVNADGCFAALSSASTTCKKQWTIQSACDYGSCTSCTTNGDYSACLDSAFDDTGANSCDDTYPIGSSCQAPLNAAYSDTTIQTKCGYVTGGTVESQALAVAKTLCGAP
ncbi:MAG TPA: hypothetical protein VF407_21900 [Polyangiaceae bacterium]